MITEDVSKGKSRARPDEACDSCAGLSPRSAVCPVVPTHESGASSSKAPQHAQKKARRHSDGDDCSIRNSASDARDDLGGGWHDGLGFTDREMPTPQESTGCRPSDSTFVSRVVDGNPNPSTDEAVEQEGSTDSSSSYRPDGTPETDDTSSCSVGGGDYQMFDEDDEDSCSGGTAERYEEGLPSFLERIATARNGDLLVHKRSQDRMHNFFPTDKSLKTQSFARSPTLGYPMKGGNHGAVWEVYSELRRCNMFHRASKGVVESWLTADELACRTARVCDVRQKERIVLFFQIGIFFVSLLAIASKVPNIALLAHSTRQQLNPNHFSCPHRLLPRQTNARKARSPGSHKAANDAIALFCAFVTVHKPSLAEAFDDAASCVYYPNPSKVT